MKAVLVALALLVYPVSGVAAPASQSAPVSQVAEKEEKGGGFPWVTFLILFVVFGGLTAFRKKDQAPAGQTDNDKAQ